MLELNSMHVNLCTDCGEAADAYSRLASRMALLNEQKGYKIFAFSGCEPQAGTTTVTYNIAVILSKCRKRTLLIDADIRKGLTSMHQNQGIAYGLSDALRAKDRHLGIIHNTNFEFLDYISCGSKCDDSFTIFGSDYFGQFLENITDRYDYLILDSPGINQSADAGIIARKSSALILVARHMHTRKGQIASAQRQALNADSNIAGIILNKVPKHGGKSHKKRHVKAFPQKKRHMDEVIDISKKPFTERAEFKR